LQRQATTWYGIVFNKKKTQKTKQNASLVPYRTVGTSGSPVTNPGRWEGATEAGKGPAWPVSPERAASGLPASPAAGTPALSPAVRDGSRMAAKRCKDPHGQQTALPNGKPARPQARSPFRPGVHFPGSRAAAPRSPAPQALVAIPAAGCTYLPSPRLRGRRQSHRPRPRRRRPPRAPPAAALARTFICGSRSHKMALREESRPCRRPRPARTAPRPERAAETPPVAHSPETRLSGASSVTAPGASGEKGRGAAGSAPLGTSGRGEAAALRRRRTETVRGSPHRPRRGSASSAGLGREAAGEKGGPARSEVTREASRDDGRCRTSSAGPPAAAARPGRRNPSRQARDWLFQAVSQLRMLPRIVPERGDSGFMLKRPSF
jgi:hypothetical protein